VNLTEPDLWWQGKHGGNNFTQSFGWNKGRLLFWGETFADFVENIGISFALVYSSYVNVGIFEIFYQNTRKTSHSPFGGCIDSLTYMS
jgi:hypothetical protein